MGCTLIKVLSDIFKSWILEQETIVEYAHQANMMQFNLKNNYIYLMKNLLKGIRTETRRLVQLHLVR